MDEGSKESAKTWTLSDVLNSDPESLDITISVEETSSDVFGFDDFYETLREIIESPYTVGTAIGLTGPWGSGKSSAVKIVEGTIHDKNSVDIVYFDAWTYADPASLVMGLYDRIRELYSPRYLRNARKIAKTILKLFSESHDAWIQDTSRMICEVGGDPSFVRDSINKMIKRSGKKLVVVIENSDRSETPCIKGLFAAINGIFRLDNTLFIITYDEEVVKNRFDANESLYLDKVISRKLSVPVPSREDYERVLKKSISNISKLFEKKPSQDSMGTLSSLVSALIRNPRDCAVLLNIVIDYGKNPMPHVDFVDFVIVRFIDYSDNGLYRRFCENRQYVCTRELPPLSESEEAYAKECSEFFENFGKKYDDPLGYVIPNYSRYHLKKEPPDRTSDKCLFSDARYNDYYFSRIRRVHQRIEYETWKIQENGPKALCETLDRYEDDPRRIGEYQALLEKLVDSTTDSSHWTMEQIFGEIVARSGKIGQSAMIRLLKTIIQKQPDNACEWIQKISTDKFDLIYVLFALSCHSGLNLNERQSRELSNTLRRICEHSIANLNLYDNEHYVQYNTFGIIGTVEQERIREYMLKCLDDDTKRVRFLFDVAYRLPYGTDRLEFDAHTKDFMTNSQLKDVVNSIDVQNLRPEWADLLERAKNTVNADALPQSWYSEFSRTEIHWENY